MNWSAWVFVAWLWFWGAYLVAEMLSNAEIEVDNPTTRFRNSLAASLVLISALWPVLYPYIFISDRVRERKQSNQKEK